MITPLLSSNFSYVNINLVLCTLQIADYSAYNIIYFTEKKFVLKENSRIVYKPLILSRVCIMVFNATFNNMFVISWRSVLLVEETGENNQPVESH